MCIFCFFIPVISETDLYITGLKTERYAFWKSYPEKFEINEALFAGIVSSDDRGCIFLYWIYSNLSYSILSTSFFGCKCSKGTSCVSIYNPACYGSIKSTCFIECSGINPAIMANYGIFLSINQTVIRTINTPESNSVYSLTLGVIYVLEQNLSFIKSSSITEVFSHPLAEVCYLYCSFHEIELSDHYAFSFIVAKDVSFFYSSFFEITTTLSLFNITCITFLSECIFIYVPKTIVIGNSEKMWFYKCQYNIPPSFYDALHFNDVIDHDISILPLKELLCNHFVKKVELNDYYTTPFKDTKMYSEICMNNCHFDYSVSNEHGGAVFISTIYFNLTIELSTFSSCTTFSASYRLMGGAIYANINDGNIRISKCCFLNCSANIAHSALLGSRYGFVSFINSYVGMCSESPQNEGVFCIQLDSAFSCQLSLNSTKNYALSHSFGVIISPLTLLNFSHIEGHVVKTTVLLMDQGIFNYNNFINNSGYHDNDPLINMKGRLLNSVFIHNSLNLFNYSDFMNVYQCIFDNETNLVYHQNQSNRFQINPITHNILLYHKSEECKHSVYFKKKPFPVGYIVVASALVIVFSFGMLIYRFNLAKRNFHEHIVMTQKIITDFG